MFQQVQKKNAFTVDVEDYFQVEAFSDVISRKKWSSFESRVVNNTYNILDLMSESDVNGTFFVLGWVAKRYPEIVKEIISRGHEVASHGMSHKLIYKQSIDEFRNETIDSKKILEDIIQKDIIGYRAATYSITKKSLWALDVLIEAGYLYDSSIFPMKHDRYGISDACPVPHILETQSGGKITEFPITTLKMKYITLPVAGGGYFRLFPYWLTRYGLNKLVKNSQNIVFYIHPWEIDHDQPRIKASKLSEFRHYNNIHKCRNRLKKLFGDFSFTTMEDVLKHESLITLPS